jgi:hypothetical protein
MRGHRKVVARVGDVFKIPVTDELTVVGQIVADHSPPVNSIDERQCPDST